MLDCYREKYFLWQKQGPNHFIQFVLLHRCVCVCVSECVCIFDHHANRYICNRFEVFSLLLEDMIWLLGICVFICRTFVAFNPHNAFFATGTLCLPTQLPLTCSIYRDGTKCKRIRVVLRINHLQTPH